MYMCVYVWGRPKDRASLPAKRACLMIRISIQIQTWMSLKEDSRLC